MNKARVIDALVELLKLEIARATDSAQRTRKGAIHEEARPENDKDTRALEASYLARGQAQRVVELEREAKQITFMTRRDFKSGEPIDVGALIWLEDEDGRRWLLLAPAAGGRSIVLDDCTIEVITPHAPLGRALVGRVQGEDLELRIGPRTRELTIVEVR